MNESASAALSSWSISGSAALTLALAFLLYVRGWLRGRTIFREGHEGGRLASWIAGLICIFIAIASPLNAFDSIYLSAHMAQHFLLMMLAPALILLSRPLLPLLRGLPRPFVREGLGPFLTWDSLRLIGDTITHPVVTWLVFAASTVIWHLPRFYELALSSSRWHAVQHASFFWSGILFWWPVIQPGLGKPRFPSWIGIPYLLLADFLNTALSVTFVFSGRVIYPSYAATATAISSVLEDQTFAGLIMWVPGSVIYLIPAFLLVMKLFAHSGVRSSGFRLTSGSTQRARWTSLATLARYRRVLQFAMLLLAIAVAADGWFGTQFTPMNLAGVLPWIHWRALTVAGLLIVGNLFCMACPFTLVRDWGRRVLPANVRWPKMLRNKWLAIGLFVVYLWAYEAFALWDKPFVTAVIIAGYFLAALIVDGFFRDASFCKYVCPIGQFNFVTSLLSPKEVAIKRTATCESCQTFDCIRGNERQRGCELYLFQPKKSSNLDCTFCLECVKACPHDNVALLPVIPAKTVIQDPYRSSLGRLSKRTDLAALVLVFVFGALSNAAGMTGPVMIWEHRWHAMLGPHAMPWIVGLFTLLCAVVLPAILALACGFLNRLSGIRDSAANLTRRLVYTAVPLGVSLWAAHFLFHFATSWSAVLPIAGRMSNVGMVALTPSSTDWITAAQISLLNAGLLCALYLAWRILRQYGKNTGSSVVLLSPWAAVFLGFYITSVWTFFQPMAMRGMVH